jgi:hypothetical protein
MPETSLPIRAIGMQAVGSTFLDDLALAEYEEGLYEKDLNDPHAQQ